MRYTYTKHRFNGFYYQRIPSGSYETYSLAESSRNVDLDCGIDCGNIKLQDYLK